MAKSQQSFNKKEREKKRMQKQKAKQQTKEERKASSEGGGLENMMAYVDEFGNITDTPPDPTKKKIEIEAESIEIGVPKREKEEYDPIRKGRVEFFNHDKGYGFIKDAVDGEKYFVHINGVIDEIDEGDKVIFELEKGMKGLNAVRVKLDK